MNPADVLRAFALVSGFASLGLSLSTLFYYERAREKAPPGTPQLLLWHVVAITVSHLLLTFGAIAEIYARKNDELTWRPFVYAPAFIISLIALYIILRFERSRLSAHQWGNDVGDVGGGRG